MVSADVCQAAQVTGSPHQLTSSRIFQRSDMVGEVGCTVQYSTVKYSTFQYSAVQCSTVQYSTLECSAVQYITVQCSTVQYGAVHIDTQNGTYITIRIHKPKNKIT